MFDDTIVLNQVHDYLQCARPGSYFYNPGSSGGWAPGAAFGAKLAAPDRNVVAITGDGFYMFATAIHSLWSAAQYNAPYLTIVYQNRSYSTGHACASHGPIPTASPPRPAIPAATSIRRSTSRPKRYPLALMERT